eukprot:746084-Hanusia_phi.AAC.3
MDDDTHACCLRAFVCLLDILHVLLEVFQLLLLPAISSHTLKVTVDHCTHFSMIMVYSDFLASKR